MSTFAERAKDYEKISGGLEEDGFWRAARGPYDPIWHQGLLSGLVFLLGGEAVEDVVPSGDVEDDGVRVRADIFTQNRLIRCSAKVKDEEGPAEEVSTYAIGLASVIRVDVVSRYHNKEVGDQYPTIDEATLHFRDHEPIKVPITGRADAKKRRTAMVEAIVMRLA